MRFGSPFRAIFKGELGFPSRFLHVFKPLYLYGLGIDHTSSTFDFHLRAGGPILVPRLRSKWPYFFQPTFFDDLGIIFDVFFVDNCSVFLSVRKRLRFPCIWAFWRVICWICCGFVVVFRSL